MNYTIKIDYSRVNKKILKFIINKLELLHNLEKLYDKNLNNNCFLMLLVCGICSVSAFIAAQFWSNTFDFILPVNVSQVHPIPITVEYFIDQEKYFYWILLHINVAFCVGVTAMVATGTMLLAYLQHTCGMFRISR